MGGAGVCEQHGTVRQLKQMTGVLAVWLLHDAYAAKIISEKTGRKYNYLCRRTQILCDFDLPVFKKCLR